MTASNYPRDTRWSDAHEFMAVAPGMYEVLINDVSYSIKKLAQSCFLIQGSNGFSRQVRFNHYSGLRDYVEAL